MANTFPGSGNVGIGTTTPPNLLTIDTGTGNSTLALARISGKSPAWVFGSPNTGYCGGEAFIGLVTTAGDYVASAPIGDSFFFNLSNAGRMLIGRTTGDGPVMAVHNAGANVAVGLGVDTPGGRFVAARPISGAIGTVELQGNNATTGAHALVLGYQGPYNTRPFGEAAFIQSELQGLRYAPLNLQPFGGLVTFGLGAGFALPDFDSAGNRYKHRFIFNQEITDVADPNVGEHVMATFEMVSEIPAGTPKRDTGCGRFVLKQRLGGAWIRALEAQAVRESAATNARTWGIEVGVHNATNRVSDPHVSVGIYIHAADPNWTSGVQRNNTGILIDGRPGGDGDGWDDFIRCRNGSLNTSTSARFWVGHAGNVWAKHRGQRSAPHHGDHHWPEQPRYYRRHPRSRRHRRLQHGVSRCGDVRDRLHLHIVGIVEGEHRPDRHGGGDGVAPATHTR